MSERAATDDGAEGDEHARGGDDTSPCSIARPFRRRGPPTAEELRRFDRRLPKVVEACSRLADGKPDIHRRQIFAAVALLGPAAAGR
jgi:hypothetical protein